MDTTASTRAGARPIGAGPTALDVMVALRAVEKCVDGGGFGDGSPEIFLKAVLLHSVGSNRVYLGWSSEGE